MLRQRDDTIKLPDWRFPGYSERVTPARAGGYELRLDGTLILVVEDHADSRDVLRQFLESLGAKVLLAGDGIEALHILEARVPDIVLTDIRMPRMDGVQLAYDQLRCTPEHGDSSPRAATNTPTPATSPAIAPA